MDKTTLETLALIERAVLAAGTHIVESAAQQRKLDVRVKEDATLVLNLDIESQAIILERLAGSLPIVAEEDETSHSLIESEGNYLLVDPIDGTTSCKRFLNARGGQIGFGPLVGMVERGRLKLAAFYHVPQRTLFSAVRGEGTWSVEMEPGQSCPPLESRVRRRVEDISLAQSALLFYPGVRGEVSLVEVLRARNLVENVYRFGGFANDCARLSQGSEQIQIQFAVRPWDLPAVLFPLCAGLEVVFDPFGKCLPIEEWSMAHNNPVIVAHSNLMQQLLSLCRDILESKGRA